MGIAENISGIKCSLPPTVKLVAVSKTKPVEMILEAYKAGQRVFGENKAQELEHKFPLLPNDIEWHFIGHLQTNKVKYIAPFVGLVHSVDSLKLLGVVDSEAQKAGRVIPCLLQFFIADETTKFGLTLEEAKALLESSGYKAMKNIEISGVMGMATFTENIGQVRKEFASLKKIFDFLKKEYFDDSPGFKEISMGMSDDYRIAVEEGSTIVRIGGKIFGPRG
jgi:PLP dependent protein